jgi:hypothetical protein
MWYPLVRSTDRSAFKEEERMSRTWQWSFASLLVFTAAQPGLTADPPAAPSPAHPMVAQCWQPVRPGTYIFRQDTTSYRKQPAVLKVAAKLQDGTTVPVPPAGERISPASEKDNPSPPPAPQKDVAPPAPPGAPAPATAPTPAPKEKIPLDNVSTTPKAPRPDEKKETDSGAPPLPPPDADGPEKAPAVSPLGKDGPPVPVAPAAPGKTELSSGIPGGTPSGVKPAENGPVPGSPPAPAPDSSKNPESPFPTAPPSSAPLARPDSNIPSIGGTPLPSPSSQENQNALPPGVKPETGTKSSDKKTPSFMLGQNNPPAPLEKGSPWVLKVEIVGTVTHVIASSRDAEFRVICQNLKMQSPSGEIHAEGGVKVSASGMEVTCDRLVISWLHDWVVIEGGVRLQTEKDGQRVELTGEQLRLKLTTLTAKAGVSVPSSLQKASFQRPVVRETLTPPAAPITPAITTPASTGPRPTFASPQYYVPVTK